MKNVILAFALVLGCTFAKAQTDTLQLQGMTKVALADVYLKEVQRVCQNLALVAFDTVSHSVPATKYTQAKFDKVTKKMDAYKETLMLQFLEIIPYADKKQIIDSIVYLRSL